MNRLKKKCHCISVSIIKNPKLDSAQIRISQFDSIDELGSKKSGYLLNFGSDDDSHPIWKFIAWNVVLKGCMTSIQV